METQLESYRPRLFGIAYRMLGEVQDAEDVVQEAFLRWHQADPAEVRSPEAWLVAVTTRLAIDRLRRAATERAAYEGPWLPEPVAAGWEADRGAELASDLSMAFLVLLERLAPEERAAFLLREVFDADYAEIARVLSKSEAAARQTVHRARERVRADRVRQATVSPEVAERLLHRFLAAIDAGDQDALLAVLAPDVTLTSDGGGKVPAARNVLVGPDRIAAFLLGLQRKYRGAVAHRVAWLAGEPAIVSRLGDQLAGVTAIATDGERITAVYRVLNPEKLRHMGGEKTADC